MSKIQPDELISGYLDGELTSLEQQRVEQALGESAELRRLCDELRVLKNTLQAMPASPSPPDLTAAVLAEIHHRTSAISADADASADAEPPDQLVAPTAGRWHSAAWKRGWALAGTLAGLAALVIGALWLPAFDAAPEAAVAERDTMAAATAGRADAAAADAMPADAMPADRPRELEAVDQDLATANRGWLGGGETLRRSGAASRRTRSRDLSESARGESARLPKEVDALSIRSAAGATTRKKTSPGKPAAAAENDSKPSGKGDTGRASSNTARPKMARPKMARPKMSNAARGG